MPGMRPDRLYEYLTLSRQRVFDWVRGLTDEQYAREFEIGNGSIAQTYNHLLISEWYYVLRMLERDVPPVSEIMERDAHPPTLAHVEAEWESQAAETRAAIAQIKDWSAPIRYVVERDGKDLAVHTTIEDIFTQLVLHEMHHRSQILNMLRQLGVTTEDIDFNLLMYRFEDV